MRSWCSSRIDLSGVGWGGVCVDLPVLHAKNRYQNLPFVDVRSGEVSRWDIATTNRTKYKCASVSLVHRSFRAHRAQLVVRASLGTVGHAEAPVGTYVLVNQIEHHAQKVQTSGPMCHSARTAMIPVTKSCTTPHNMSWPPTLATSALGGGQLRKHHLRVFSCFFVFFRAAVHVSVQSDAVPRERCNALLLHTVHSR
jgi:hypothetical protein